MNKYNDILEKMMKKEFIEKNVIACVTPVSDKPTIKRPFLDLEEFIAVYFPEEEALVKYTDSALANLPFTKDELFEIAYRNMKDQLNMFTLDVELPFIVVTNKYLSYGAGVMCSTEILDCVCEVLQSDKIYILPSSRHEVICLVCEDNAVDTLNEMIQSVNVSEVAPEDILSNHYYLYEKETKEITF